MTDKQRLQKAVDELKKANTEQDELLKKAVQQINQSRQEQKASPYRPK